MKKYGKCSDCKYWNISGWARSREKAKRVNCDMILRPDLYGKSQECIHPRGSLVEIYSNCGELPTCTHALTDRNFGCVLFEKKA
jgi:hypothetical protein